MTPKQYISYLKKQGIPLPSLLFLASAEFGERPYTFELGNCRRPLNEDYSQETQRYIDSLPAKPSLLFLASEVADTPSLSWRGVSPYCIQQNGANTGMRGFKRVQLYDSISGRAMGVTKPNIEGEEGYIAPVLNEGLCPIPATLNISTTSIEVGASEYSFDLGITSNSDWEVVTTSIVSVDQNSGNGDDTIRVTISGHTTEEERSGAVTVSTLDGSVSRVLEIRQDGYVPSELSVSPSSFDVDHTAGSVTIHLNSNKPWTTEINGDITLSDAEGDAGEFDITLSYGLNSTFDPVESQVTFISDGVEKTVTITQAAHPSYLDDYSRTVAADDSGSFQITIHTGGAWTVQDNAWWTTLSENSGTGTQTITVYYQMNYGESRFSEISFFAGAETLTFNLTQQAVILYDVLLMGGNIMGEGSDTPDAAYGASQPMVRYSTSEDVQIMSQFFVESSANTLFNGKDKWFRVDGTDFVIKIDSEGYVTEINDPTQELTISPIEYEADVSSGSTTINITSNADWEVINVPSWATVSQDSGNGNATVTLNWDDNSGSQTAERSAEVIVKTPDGYIERVFTLVQEGTEITFNLSTDRIDFQKNSPMPQYIAVESPYPWTVTSKPSWITVNPSSGTASTGEILQQIQVTAGTNFMDARTGTIEVTSGGETKSVRVNQD